MYIQITTRCNFHCKHCGMSCTKKGEDMSLETFRNAIAIVFLYDGDSISLGGGEPTLHPLFWQFLGESLSKVDSVWLATNGSQTEISIALANLAKKGVLSVALSQDKYHDPIDPKVIDAFKSAKPLFLTTYDGREIRNVENNLIKAGKCKTGKIGCICEDMVIKPDGTVRGCGCDTSPIFGNINSKVTIPGDWEWGMCYKEQPTT